MRRRRGRACAPPDTMNRLRPHERRPSQIHPRRAGHPDPLGQPDGRPARRRPAAAPSRHHAAGRPGRPRPALPNGADPPGGLAPSRRSRFPSRSATPTSCGAPRLCTVRGASSASSIRPPTSITSTRAGRPRGRISRTPPSPRPTRTRRPGSRSSRPRPAPASGARRSRSPASCSAWSARCGWSARATTRSPTAAR